MRRTNCILAVAACSIVGCSANKWRDIEDAEGKYVVSMPAEPTRKTKPIGDKLTMYMNTAEVRNVAYLAAFMPLQGGSFDYSAGIQGMAKTYQGPIRAETEFEFQGQKGRAFEIEMQSPFRGVAVGRMVVVNDTLYQLIVVGKNIHPSDADVLKFFDSFKVK